MKVLVTGATGYIGGRLVSRLLELGYSVRVLARDPERARGRAWGERVEIHQGDMLEPETLPAALEGIDAAYYLVHSMYAGPGFDQIDRQAAENFCEAGAHLDHVIYLGGLLPQNPRFSKRSSKHLHSRAEIGRIIGRHLPSTELRAGPIIGSGSASFELLRYLTERVPIMFAPSWVRNEVLPIAVRDILAYLVLALERGPSGVVEVGSETITYKQMMLGYARIRGLRRLIIPIPAFLPPWLGAGWVGLVTPIPTALAIPLIEGMEQPLVAHKYRAGTFFPQVEPISYANAVRRALRRIEERAVETRWSDTQSRTAGPRHTDSEGMIREVRERHVDASPEAVFRIVSGLGGERGWLTWKWAWALRGWIDQLLGGPGIHRGRRHPDQLVAGEALDCWRVESVSSPTHLRLRTEMKLPGRGWLQWETEPDGDGTRLIQTAAFAPRGLAGALYWYSLYPLHKRIFTDLIRAIQREAAAQPTKISATPGLETGHSADPAELSCILPQQDPPARTRSIWGDVHAFLLHRPETSTLIRFATAAEKADYSRRILQRIGTEVGRYSVLNLHKIGVHAPVRYVFEELLAWSGDSTCWPNHIASVDRMDEGVEHLNLQLFGRKGKPLFNMHLKEIHAVPGDSDPDNARYLLYECRGGYPIGIFVIYVRSPIASQVEPEATQVFLGVGFDFYGREKVRLFHPLNRIWESVHNRVTSNVMNRFKDLCEWRFRRTQAGLRDERDG